MKKKSFQYCFLPSSSSFPYKEMKKKIGDTSLCRSCWSSVMVAGPKLGDSFTLNLYNKVIPHHQILKYWDFLQKFFFADIFSGCLQVFAKKKKNRIWYLVFAKIEWVKG